MSSHVRKMLLAPIPVVVVILLFIGMRLTQSTVDSGDQVSTLPQSTVAVAASFPAATTSKPMVFTAAKQYAEPSAEWIKANALVPSVDGPGATLKLTPRAIAAVTMGVQRQECPRRYVFVNTHTFGRHHNQLQEMLNLAIWARSLNRTAVVGWFRHSHKWTPMDSLYDFSALQRDYCVVSVATFASEWKTVADKSAVCVGQDIKSTPIKAYVRCRLLPGVPAHYDARYGVTSTKPFIGLATSEPSVTAATFLGLSGEIAFFIRPGLLEQVAASMRVQPVPEIVEEARSFAAKAGLRLDGSSEDPSAARATATSTASSRPAPYFALHLRQREKECMKEMNHSWTDSQGLLSGLTEETRRRISGQCAVTVAQLDDMLAALGLTVGDKGALKLYLASDHQSVALEQALLRRGAIMYEGGKYHTREMGGLQGLGVDYTLLLRAHRFTGNQLSSVSQNCCFHRLGKGLPCDGFVADFTLYHSRVVDGSVFVPNVRWPMEESP
jgi:hypothetical protein